HVVDLHNIYGSASRSTADEIDVTIMRHADHGAIHRNRYILCTVPSMILGQIRVHVAQHEFVSLSVNRVSAEKIDLALGPNRGRPQPSRHSRHRTPFDPLPRS